MNTKRVNSIFNIVNRIYIIDPKWIYAQAHMDSANWELNPIDVRCWCCIQSTQIQEPEKNNTLKNLKNQCMQYR